MKTSRSLTLTKTRVLRVAASGEEGHVLLVAMCIIALMALVAGGTLAAISARYKTAWRTAAWHESLLTAESGVDLTIAQVAGLLPDIQLDPKTALSLASSPLSTTLLTGLKLEPGGLNLKNGVTVSLTPDPLVHGGEGSTVTQATVSIDVLPLNQLLSTNLVSGALNLLSPSGQAPAINLLRLRSKGVVFLPSSNRSADVFKLDAELNQAMLVKDRQTGQRVTTPYIAREVEVILKPVFPFQNGVVSAGTINAPNAATLFDSFSSASALSSTNGLYDSSKRHSKIDVSSNGSNVTLAGMVYGDVSTNGGNIVKNSQITGSVNNGSYEPTPSLKVPTWTVASTIVSGAKTISAGALLTPAQFKYSSVNGTLHVTANAVGGLGSLLGGSALGSVVNSEADIFVTGDFTGTLIVDAGVQVKLYVQGNVTMAASGLQNSSNVAANVEILGVPPSSGTPTISIDTTGGVIASIYAPNHNVTLNGNGDFSGAITSAQLNIPNAAQVHFDEALALQLGPLLGYSLVSWQEIPVQ